MKLSPELSHKLSKLDQAFQARFGESLDSDYLLMFLALSLNNQRDQLLQAHLNGLDPLSLKAIRDALTKAAPTPEESLALLEPESPTEPLKASPPPSPTPKESKTDVEPATAPRKPVKRKRVAKSKA